MLIDTMSVIRNLTVMAKLKFAAPTNATLMY